MVFPYGCIDLIFRKDKLESVKQGLTNEIIKTYNVSPAQIDDNLVLVRCAMNSLDAENMINKLQTKYGLTYLKDGKAIDLVLIRGLSGVCVECEWIKTGYLEETTIIDGIKYFKGFPYYEFDCIHSLN